MIPTKGRSAEQRSIQIRQATRRRHYHSRMSKRLRWGVLSTAAIGVKKVLPGMKKGGYVTLAAIASRDLSKAQAAAESLGIPKAYGSYEELVADPGIDAIYNPLPNHLHVPWTIKAAEAGKHVLCEKPIGLNVAEVKALIAVRNRTGVKIGEAFMIRSHPQWLRTQELIREGQIGELRSVVGYFSYFNDDPGNIRNKAEYGGGALLDIGCYLIQAARLAFRQEPKRVVSSVDIDPRFGIDRLTSAILEFETGQAIFTCSTQMVNSQRVHFIGTKGRIEIEIPFNAPKDQPTRLFIDAGRDPSGREAVVEEFARCDQYTLQGDDFSRAILDGTEVPVNLEESVRNMAVIEAVFHSAKVGQWVKISRK